MSWIYFVGVGKYLTESQMENNAKEFYYYFNNFSFTLESIAGMLGNIQRESTINPAIKQTESTSSGWGLIQWTPSANLTDYTDSIGVSWYSGDAQCELIRKEIIEGYGGQWLPSSTHPEYKYTGKEFSEMKDVDLATKTYLFQRERAGIEKLDERLENAHKWYKFLGGVTPKPPIVKGGKLPIYMMISRRRF